METWLNNGVRYITEQDYKTLSEENKKLSLELIQRNKVIDDLLACFRKTTDTMINAEAIVNQLAGKDTIDINGEKHQVPAPEDLMVDMFLNN